LFTVIISIEKAKQLNLYRLKDNLAKKKYRDDTDFRTWYCVSCHRL